METSIRSKANMKIDRDRLSTFLKKSLINEVITSYYKCEQTETFKTMKNIVEDLHNLKRKQANLIAFFTYDFNGDNFICEEDLYHFLEKLPYNALLMEDINMIVEFMRKNKVRSTQTNLPKQLIMKKHKMVVNSIWKEHTSNWSSSS